ncbi:peptidase family S49-domain-containing protein [Baffinella frigidus]|nr:peptidase family S49-domain-containing protein [Cryptophyta sp. CCMP2293]
MAQGETAARADRKHVYVLSFPGDVTASQVEGLREEISALKMWAKADRGDEVILKLNTGGGTVTGYGLAAAQLMRIKDMGLTLTICVEQVAASGGYMMACCADEIIASPFAVIGSIGVISEQPNVYERLTREGVVFNTVTAGKFKRTLTPFKKTDPQDLAKTAEDIAQVLVLFKDWITKQRPSVDIEAVATGETWFGPDALTRNLVDRLATSDDVLLDRIDAECELFSIKYKDPSKAGPLGMLGISAEPASLRQVCLGTYSRVGRTPDHSPV